MCRNGHGHGSLLRPGTVPVLCVNSQCKSIFKSLLASLSRRPRPHKRLSGATGQRARWGGRLKPDRGGLETFRIWFQPSEGGLEARRIDVKGGGQDSPGSPNAAGLVSGGPEASPRSFDRGRAGDVACSIKISARRGPLFRARRCRPPLPLNAMGAS
jgi:hypothetical protein